MDQINPDMSLVSGITKLQLTYFGHIIWREQILEKNIMTGKIEGMRSGKPPMAWHYYNNDDEDSSRPLQICSWLSFLQIVYPSLRHGSDQRLHHSSSSNCVPHTQPFWVMYRKANAIQRHDSTLALLFLIIYVHLQPDHMLLEYWHCRPSTSTGFCKSAIRRVMYIECVLRTLNVPNVLNILNIYQGWKLESLGSSPRCKNTFC